MRRPWRRRLLFRTVWSLGWVVLTLGLRIRIEGDVPKGSAILVSNHPNYIDGPLAFYLSPRVRVIAKPNPYVPIQKAMYAYDAFVTRRGAARDARRHLGDGGLVWIVPEGILSKGPMGRPRRGAAQLALEAGAPIVTAAMVGTAGLRLRDWRPWRRPAVRVVLGKARYVLPGENLRDVADQYMEELSEVSGTPYIWRWPQ